MLVYLDSSAIIKRVLPEPESTVFEDALEAWVARDTVIASSLSGVEVARGLRARLDAGVDPAMFAEAAEQALADIPLHPLDPDVLSLARVIGPPRLRTLDAIHLATAALLHADLVVSYDDRLIRAANELGFRTSAPR